MDETKSQNEVRINNCKRLAAPPLDCGVNFLFRHGYRGVGMTSDRKCNRLAQAPLFLLQHDGHVTDCLSKGQREINCHSCIDVV